MVHPEDPGGPPGHVAGRGQHRVDVGAPIVDRLGDARRAELARSRLAPSAHPRADPATADVRQDVHGRSPMLVEESPRHEPLSVGDAQPVGRRVEPSTPASARRSARSSITSPVSWSSHAFTIATTSSRSAVAIGRARSPSGSPVTMRPASPGTARRRPARHAGGRSNRRRTSSKSSNGTNGIASFGSAREVPWRT